MLPAEDIGVGSTLTPAVADMPDSDTRIVVLARDL
jgi:hypothetical protein